jgi:Domain of unknown function (DUF4123)
VTTDAPPGTWALPAPGGGDQELGKVLKPMAGDLYVVADGARHPRLVDGMAARGLVARSLWLEHGEAGVQENGPWMARLETLFAVDDMLNVLGAGCQAVFWQWRYGEMALFRHLRHLNLVEIPLEEPPEEGRDVHEGFAHETVLFRHWDPEVLAPMLPLFEADQRARFFGVAEGIVFSSIDYGGLTAVSAPLPFRPPDPTRQLLRFSREQMDGIRISREGTSRRRIADYVRQHCGAGFHTAALDQALAEGALVGLRKERSLGLWCWLWTRTDGAVYRDPAFRNALNASEFRDPDDAMLKIADGMESLLRASDKSPWRS